MPCIGLHPRARNDVMSKPRWMDAGVLRTLRTATRNRKLTVIVGPLHGTALISSRADLKNMLGDADRSTLAADARCRSAAVEGLRWLHALRQPVVVTTSVSDALEAAVSPEQDPAPRSFGPDSKGIVTAFDRKEPAIVHLHGRAADPTTLVLSTRDRKPLLRPDSRYQAFLRALMSRTVVFSGFRLDDPDLMELLDDISRVFNGHVPSTLALVAAGATDPAAALRANMHYGMMLVEYPSDLGVDGALEDIARLLEELEVPKPATGNPPRGFVEIDARFMEQVPASDRSALESFDAGDASGWSVVKSGAVVTRASAAEIAEALLAPAVPDGKPRVVLVKGREGEGKTCLLRRLAWDLGVAAGNTKNLRVFWRESGSDLPDDYIPAEADDARALFVVDDGGGLEALPTLLRALAARPGGKARLLLAVDSTRWERSGMDHRFRPLADVVDIDLAGGLDPAAASAMAEGLGQRGRLPGTTPQQAASRMLEGDGPLIERLSRARGAGSLCDLVAAAVQSVAALPEGELAKRVCLGVALVHQYGLGLGAAHLARFVGGDEPQLSGLLALEGMARLVVQAADGVLRTPHPLVAAAAVSVLAPGEAQQDEALVQLLVSFDPGTTTGAHQLHFPSELIRARRQRPLPPLMLTRFFEAAQALAGNDRNFWFDRGRHESDYSRWEPALAAFDHALWPRPEDAREKEHNALVQANRSRCLSSLGRKKEALRAAEEGLRLAPNDASLLRLQEKLGGRRRPPPRRGAQGNGAGGASPEGASDRPRRPRSDARGPRAGTGGAGADGRGSGGGAGRPGGPGRGGSGRGGPPARRA